MEKETLLIKLEKVHRVYKKAGEEMREKLFNASSSLIGELVKVGYSRDFVETLLMWGEEFLTNCDDFNVGEELFTRAKQIFSGEWLLIKVAEHTGVEGMREASFWALKSGYSVEWTRWLLSQWVGRGILQYAEGRDMWSANLTTRIKYGFTVDTTTPKAIEPAVVALKTIVAPVGEAVLGT